ncbi:alpha/beta hydrolase [Pedobacter heparinus]|uniref:alpha/beta hydrolase n=1 Tax=Pedobacter heparinus TaxID=984 RepID=UPI002931DD0C|nr:alpha/beta fold hydrolase [Pedobacter heparinus]
MKLTIFTKKLFALMTLFILFSGSGIGMPKDSLLVYRSKSGQEKSVKTKAEWETKRKQVLDRMQLVMGKLPDSKNLPPLNIKVTDSLKEDNHTRYTIRFTVAKDETLTADLYVPHQSGKTKKLPAILALHGTSDVGKRSIAGEIPKPNRAYAKELAQRGYVVIAPDYPSFGEQKNYNFEQDRYESGTMKAIFNHIRCVDLLQARKDVDPERIGVIGHSLGGHNAIFVGAFDPRLKVVVSSCGWTLFENYNAGEDVTKKFGGKLGAWAQTRYMPLVRDKYQLDAAQMPFDFDEAIAVLAPRPFFSNSPVGDANFDVKGVEKGISNVTEVYKFLNAADRLQVSYPDAAHDFPPETRLSAYAFIDKALNHTSIHQKLLF